MTVVGEGTRLSDALARLREIAPDAPLLALGQTVFWDEPMKALVAAAAPERSFIAGVHDTDYFAKLPSGPRRPGAFVTVAHNDTTTRGLWSAAAEFSTLFGSETVVTRDMLLRAGLALDRLRERDPHILDTATEAWGWRGIVSLDDAPPLTSEVPALALLPELENTLGWAFGGALAVAPSAEGEALAAEIRAEVADACAPEGASLAEAYEALVPRMYGLVVPEARVGTDRTSRLLRFNRETCGRPRFSLARLFIESSTRRTARASYDEAVTAPGPNSGQYELARFGTGAIPFDLVIPGLGRGVVRLGNRGAVIGTRVPQFLSFKRPVESLEEFAAAVEAKFGPDCALIGKAVTLLGMLAAEHVFVFNEGGSGYSWRSAMLHRLLCERLAWCTALNPILRVGYPTWSALAAVERDLTLPEPLRRPFGFNTLSAKVFSALVPSVAQRSAELLVTLGETRRPIELLHLLAGLASVDAHRDWLDAHPEFLREYAAGEKSIEDVAPADNPWPTREDRYAALSGELDAFTRRMEEGLEVRATLYATRRGLRRARVEAETERGAQFRREIFERDPEAGALARRREHDEAVRRAIKAVETNERTLSELLRAQGEAARDASVRAAVNERRGIEVEAECERLTLIREATLAGEGLAHAALRPSAWWLAMVSPDGAWTSALRSGLTARLEPLRP